MSLLKNMIAKFAGKIVANKIKLKEENQMDDKKKWYASKNVWTGVVTFILGAYSLFQASVGPAIGVSLPPIPEWLFAFLGAIGVYTRVVATKQIR